MLIEQRIQQSRPRAGNAQDKERAGSLRRCDDIESRGSGIHRLTFTRRRLAHRKERVNECCTQLDNFDRAMNCDSRLAVAEGFVGLQEIDPKHELAGDGHATNEPLG